MLNCDSLMERGGLRKVVYRKEDVKESKGEKEKKNKGVKTFSWLACPLTSAYVYLRGIRVRTLNCHFQHPTVVGTITLV